MTSVRNLRLASFDGGGARSFSQLEIIGFIMHQLKWKLYPKEREKVMLPCEHFNLIGGSDTGGLIAIMFAKLRMSVEDTIEAFATIVEEVYAKSLEPEKRTEILKKQMEELLKNRGLPIDLKLEDERPHEGCAGFVLASLSLNVEKKVCLRTYPVRSQPSSSITVVEAALATCATPPGFLPLSFGTGYRKQEYVGAGIGANNPVHRVISEAHLHFGGESNVSLLLSLGSGHPGIISFNSKDGNEAMVRLTRDIMTDCLQTAREIQQQVAQTGIYFRFSVEQGMQRDVNAHAEELGWILAQTQSYLEDIDANLGACVDTMVAGVGLVTLTQLNNVGPAPIPPISVAHNRASEPESTALQVLEDLRVRWGEDNPETLLAMENVAQIYHDHERYSEAARLRLTVLEGRKRHLGDEHLDVFNAMHKLARTYQSQGRYLEAEILQVRVLEGRKEKLGEAHLDTVCALHNLAATYHEQGHYLKSEPLQLELVERWTAIYGEEDATTLDAMRWLALNYSNQSRYSDSEVLNCKLLEIRTRLEGHRSIGVAVCVYNLSSIYYMLNRKPEARIFAVKAERLFKIHYGTEHPHYKQAVTLLQRLS